MPSLFYKATFERRFPVSLLLIEEISLRIKALGAPPVEKQMVAILVEAMKKCKIVPKPDKEDIEYLSSRLESIADADPEKPEGETKKTKKGFATAFAKWSAGLEPYALCMLAAEYDYAKALQLYSEVDRDDVVELSKQLMSRDWERIRVGYESVVYGFGGGYQEGVVDHEVDVSTEDHTQGKTISKDVLKQMHF